MLNTGLFTIVISLSGGVKKVSNRIESVDEIPLHKTTAQETIYFSLITKQWEDRSGICHTCTPENGFSADGVITTDTGSIAWRTLSLSLNNDLGKSPDINEVRTFFQLQYAEKSGDYPVHVSVLKGVFLIHIAVPGELKNIDFLAPQGALVATYKVRLITINEVVLHNEERSPVSPKSTEDQSLKTIAFRFAEQIAIYTQDGYNLRSIEALETTCSHCFQFVFDHYGDPETPYKLSVRVNAEGLAELVPN